MMLSSKRAVPRRHLRIVLAGIGLALRRAPAPALANETWFIDAQGYPIRWELLFSWRVALAALSAGAALGALLWLRRRFHDPLWPNPTWLRPIESSARAVLGIQTAISLIYMAAQGWLFSPTLPLPPGAFGLALATLVVGISLTFITGWFTRLRGALLVALVAGAFALYPVAYVLEDLLFVGIGISFLLRGRGLFQPATPMMRRLARRWQPYERLALPALRVGTGLSILVLAFTEK